MNDLSAYPDSVAAIAAASRWDQAQESQALAVALAEVRERATKGTLDEAFLRAQLELLQGLPPRPS